MSKSEIKNAVKIFGTLIGLISFIIAMNADDECRMVESWRGIEGYSIEKHKCDDDPYRITYSFILYKDGKKITENGSPNHWNSCSFEFIMSSEYHLSIDVCKRTVLERRSNKKDIMFTDVDSIHIIQNGTQLKRRFQLEQIELFLAHWKKSKPVSYFYPSTKDDKKYSYKLEVFTKGETREFYINPFTMKEEGDWHYITGSANSIFRQLWKDSKEH